MKEGVPEIPSEFVSVGEAAKALGVSPDTIRRWDASGKIAVERDEANRRLIPRSELRRLGAEPERHRTGDQLSARNRFPGVVRSIEIDGVMGIVEVETGPSLVSAVITRDAIRELGIEVGDEVIAMVKSTSVMLIRE
ncbi:MAG: TOBE domain-containing protein [Solirubrobacterales bacterium]